MTPIPASFFRIVVGKKKGSRGRSVRWVKKKKKGEERSAQNYKKKVVGKKERDERRERRKEAV